MTESDYPVEQQER